MRKPLLAALLSLLVVPLSMMAADHWIRLTTPHFEMYTTNGEKQSTAALEVFEQVRYFFLQNSKSKTAPTTPVRIIAFRSEKEFKPYRFNEGSFAYYVRSQKGDFIVMQDISAEHHQAAIHEYTHLIIQHHELKLPIWLNEGLADFYSSLESSGDKAVVGRPLERHVMLLRNERWLDLNTLFDVGRESPYYNERAKMSIFYAESWALTHMLAMGKDYRPEFSNFLAAVESGRPVSECLQSIYGQTLSQVTLALHAYVQQSSLRAAVFDIKLNKLELEPNISEPSELKVDLALADLLASQEKLQAEAAERLSKLATDHPESDEVQESLGYLAWAQGNQAKAIGCFKLALDKGSKNPEMLFLYGQLLNESGATADQVLTALQRAVEIKPDYPEAWFDIGMTAARMGEYSTALNALSHIRTVKAEQAYALFSTQAFCYLRLEQSKPAREQTEKAKQYARTAEEQLQTSNLLHDLDLMDRPPEAHLSASLPSISEPAAAADAPDRPTLRHNVNRVPARDEPTVHWGAKLRHVEAIAKSFDCGSHRLRVIVNSQEMVFELADPNAIVVRNTDKGYVDFQCGVQKPFKIGIFYMPSDQSARADGVIRELVF
jgi:tetratricopeptide (TPR) repeat protein